MKHTLSSLLRASAPIVRSGLAGARVVLRTAWSIAKPVLRFAFEIALALIIVFEEWGWRPLARAIGRLAQLKPIAALEARIVRLPPYGALAVFALPTVLLLPLKFLALFLIATGHTLSAALLFLGAKVLGTAIVARLFV
jgi:hypothetical protein